MKPDDAGTRIANTSTAVLATGDKNRLKSLLPGLAPDLGDAVQIAIPSARAWTDDALREALMDAGPAATAKRRHLLAAVRGLLELDGVARRESRPLAEVAVEAGERCRAALERGAVALLEAHRTSEEALQSAARFFSNLQDSIEPLRRKIFAVNVSPRELASDAGLRRLDAELRHYYCRPDSRDSYGFVQVSGFPGTPEGKNRLARIVEKYRGVLVLDAPDFADGESLHAASSEGGVLEELPGPDVHHGRTIVIGNRVRARKGFAGRHASESSDVFIPASGAWLGTYLDNVVRGMPWRPAVGYGRPLAGVDAVEHDLLLHQHEGHLLYLKHHVNPCIRLAAGSARVVVWGPDTLSNVAGGVQIGVAVVENLLVRYTEWVVKKEGIFNELEEGQRQLSSMLNTFMRLNSGAGRMFRSGSSVRVTAHHDTRTLSVRYDLRFREVAERAVLTLKKVSGDEPGDVTVSRDRA